MKGNYLTRKLVQRQTYHKVKISYQAFKTRQIGYFHLVIADIIDELKLQLKQKLILSKGFMLAHHHTYLNKPEKKTETGFWLKYFFYFKENQNK